MVHSGVVLATLEESMNPWYNVASCLSGTGLSSQVCSFIIIGLVVKG